MLTVNSKPTRNPVQNEEVLQFINAVTQAYLKEAVETISIPRHRIAERSNNEFVADYIEQEFKNSGLTVFRQGEYNNVVATFGGSIHEAKVIVGAHYDSVPRSPGADDNGSAVAGMLAAARALSKAGSPPVAFVAFNQEEDGLLGSTDFVQNCLMKKKHAVELVHVLEMIGYASDEPGSQSVPPGLPIKIRDVGDFIAVIANRSSNSLVSSVMKVAGNYTPDLPVKALKVFWGLENKFTHLLRSDHSPFWAESIPAFMWTDTSEFRNKNYHSIRDTPDTLNYEFMQRVTQLVVAHIADDLQLKFRL